MTEPDSSALIQQWLIRHQAGDSAANAEILIHCQRRLKLLTRRMLNRYPRVRDWEETSDVFQNVMFRLMSSLQQLKFDTPADFFRLASRQINWALTDLARKTRPGLQGDWDAVEKAGKLDSPLIEDDPAKLALWEDVHRRIAELPEELRTTFDLIYYQGLTQETAATLLNVSVRTIKRRWLESRLRLMSDLGEITPF